MSPYKVLKTLRKRVSHLTKRIEASDKILSFDMAEKEALEIAISAYERLLEIEGKEWQRYA